MGKPLIGEVVVLPFPQTDLQIRPATIADARRIAKIHVETWRAAYRGQIPDDILDALDINRRAIFWDKHLATQSRGVSVAELDKEIIGFCDLIPSRDADSNSKEIGEIAAIYIQPEFWRKGAGDALCRHSLKEGRLQNYSAVTLWVLGSNTAARNFYEAIGFNLDGATKVDKSFQNYELHEVRYRISV
jgi:ribosomal protein S18 acetylase RimI-like enzyme